MINQKQNFTKHCVILLFLKIVFEFNDARFHFQANSLDKSRFLYQQIPSPFPPVRRVLFAYPQPRIANFVVLHNFFKDEPVFLQNFGRSIVFRCGFGCNY